MLTCLATIKPNHELSIHQLMEIMPPATLREAIFIIVSTRPMQWGDELSKSERLRSASGRGLAHRIVFLDASSGVLDDLLEFDRRGSGTRLEIAPESNQNKQASGDESRLIEVDPAVSAASAKVGERR
jgi:hypothetical protein